MSPEFVQSDLFNYVIMPILIFCARIIDVSIGTIRLMLIAKGRKFIAPLLGFVEVFLWILVIRQILNNVDNLVSCVAFAGGFATGNFVGMIIEEKLAMGVEVIRIITRQEGGQLMSCLRDAGFGITSQEAQGTTGKVNIIFTIVNRRERAKVIAIIKECNPGAFYSVEDIKSVREGGVFSRSVSGFNLQGVRKGK